MRSIMFILLCIIAGSASAQESVYCGKTAHDILNLQQHSISGDWNLEWTKGQINMSGSLQSMESLPPGMEMIFSMDGKTLKLQGKTVKRSFMLYTEPKDLSENGIPSAELNDVSLLKVDSISAESKCKIEQVPQVAGNMISKRKGAKNYIYLWMYSPTEMLGMSVAHNGPAIATMAFTLKKPKPE